MVYLILLNLRGLGFVCLEVLMKNFSIGIWRLLLRARPQRYQFSASNSKYPWGLTQAGHFEGASLPVCR
jgi:hypothetical protein